MTERLCKIIEWFIRHIKTFYYRLIGKNICISASIKKGCEISGEVTIGAYAYLDNNVRISGNVKIGKGTTIQRGVHISGNVEIGDGTVVGCYTTLSTMPDGLLIVGNDVLINKFSVLGASERVEIKDHCIFASHIEITDAFHGFEDPDLLIKHTAFSKAPVTIEENVWLGSGVVVLKGVKIGAGAVIGAKSLVTKSIPPLAVAYGIPARIKRFRGKKESKGENSANDTQG